MSASTREGDKPLGAGPDACHGLLNLERIERNIYRGRNRDLGAGRIFGGQVLAQALVAARHTIDEADRFAHSLHAYFILEGDLTVPVVYFVDCLRDGRSFTTRTVRAIQHGRAIFTMSASFHKREPGLAHQRPMPEAPPPETLRSDLEILREGADRIPESVRDALTRDRPLDSRPVDRYDPFDPEARPPVRRTWVRSTGTLDDAAVLHQALLAYASDSGILETALQPHGLSFQDADLMGASLDHSLWFHRPFRADDWLLYAVESPVAHGARGFARGTFFARDGSLVASVAQEGLLRAGGVGSRRARDPDASRRPA